MRRLNQVATLVIVGLIIVATVSGCSPSGPDYVESTTRYTDANLDALFDTARQSELLGRPASDTAPLRHRALVALRSKGTGGAAAADLITDTFPADTRGVPVHVERAAFDGAPAVMLLELTGPSGSPLRDVRLWVVGDSGEIAYSEVR